MLRYRDAEQVALRKESVDRNTFSIVTPHHPQLVALRKESVDRNVQDYNACVGAGKSLSARRAWIEIFIACANIPERERRSPQGERG